MYIKGEKEEDSGQSETRTITMMKEITEESEVHVRAVCRAPRVVPAAHGPLGTDVPGLLRRRTSTAGVPIRATVLLLLLLGLVVAMVIVVIPRGLGWRRR